MFEMCAHVIQLQTRPHRFRKTSAIPKFKKHFLNNSQNKREVTTNRTLKARSLKFSTFKFTQKCYNSKEPT